MKFYDRFMEKDILNQTPPFNLLANLPYQLSFYDKQLQLAYSNNQVDNIFIPNNVDQTLAPWIWESLQENPQHALHFQVPTESFESIIMQSYQVVYDENDQFQGVYSYIQDLKPLLSAYLNESGQAIVGWSDVTSGASISTSSIED